MSYISYPVYGANFTLLHIGLSIAWLSPMLVQLRHPNQTVLPEPMTEDEGSWMISISDVAGLAAIPFTGSLMNRFGRKSTMLLGCVPRVVSCFLFVFASKVWVMLVGRCLCGVADVVILSVSATYASEIASKEIRGSLGTVAQILSSIGATTMLSLGPFVTYLTMQSVNTAIICLTTAAMLFLPESPYFVYSKGNKSQSIKTLSYLRGSKMHAMKEIEEYSAIKETNLHFGEILHDNVLLKSIARAIAIAIFAQIIGYNAISYNLQTILELTHTTVSPQISSATIGCIQLFGCFCTIMLVKRVGRKPLLITSLCGLGIGQLGLGTFFKLVESYKVTGFLNYLPLISIILVIFCYNAGLGSLLFMTLAELFNERFRPFGVSLAVFTTFIFAFLTLRCFNYVIHAIGPAGTYWTFSACAVLASLFIWLAIPETEGKAFNDIQKEMADKK